MDKKKTAKSIFKVLIGIAIILSVRWLLRQQYVEFREFTPANIRDYIRAFGNLAVLAYIAAYTLNSISLFPPITPLSLTAGLAFGILYGGIFLFAAAMLGSTVAFFLSRYFGRSFIERALKGKFKDVDQKLAEKGFATVVFFRLIPIIPYGVFNYFCGLSKINFRDYFFGSLVGFIPVVFLNSFLGDSLGEIGTMDDLYSPRLYIASGLVLTRISIPFLYHYIKKYRSTDREGRKSGLTEPEKSGKIVSNNNETF